MQKTFLSHFSMATANAGDAEAKCRNPECPIGVLKWEQILSHIKKSRICQVLHKNDIRQNSAACCPRKEDGGRGEGGQGGEDGEGIVFLFVKLAGC